VNHFTGQLALAIFYKCSETLGHSFLPQKL
jgi:hypothetical protein